MWHKKLFIVRRRQIVDSFESKVLGLSPLITNSPLRGCARSNSMRYTLSIDGFYASLRFDVNDRSVIC